MEMSNLVVVVLCVIVVVLLYFLYQYLYSYSTVVYSSSLSNGNTITKITNTSSNFTYGLWIFINNWTGTYTNYPNVFYRKTTPTPIHLFFDKSNPILYADLTNDPVPNLTSKPSNVIQITDHFPIQQWVYCTISVNGKIADIYLDGLLVSSFVIPTPTATSSSTDIVLGGDSLDGSVSNFYYWTYAMGQREVWKNYTKGNSWSAVFGNMFGNYSANLQLMKNNVENSIIPLF